MSNALQPRHAAAWMARLHRLNFPDSCAKPVARPAPHAALSKLQPHNRGQAS